MNHGACNLLLYFLFLAVCVHGYTWKGYDPVRELINSKTTEASVDRDEYIPVTNSQVHVQNQAGSKETDRITKLPGQPDVNFDHYSGYVTVDPDAGRALFYYFTESNDPSTKPLVLWLNGGPGCSSFGGGAMMELGPFRVNPDGKTLWYNANAWNNVANVMYLESPAGVGFSYSNRSSDYNTGDKQTAADSYTFLVNWLERFPEYKTRDFYIAGESYAGHYVPQLAHLILKNNRVTTQTVINLKGIAIGNALVDWEDEYKGGFEFMWTHALMSDEVYSGILQNCNFSMLSRTEDCKYFESQAFKAAGNVYGYNIYAPLCSNSSSASLVSGFDPCSENYIHEYLNTPEVQKAFHANVTGVPGPWEKCSSKLQSWDDSPFTVLPNIKHLMASGIRVWMYSGDIDGAVPVTVTRYSLAKIGAPLKTPWYPWHLKGEVGGYAVGYENITFVTVRGAGHFVPSYQPERALNLFSSFLAGELPPSAI